MKKLLSFSFLAVFVLSLFFTEMPQVNAQAACGIQPKYKTEYVKKVNGVDVVDVSGWIQWDSTQWPASLANGRRVRFGANITNTTAPVDKVRFIFHDTDLSDGFQSTLNEVTSEGVVFADSTPADGSNTGFYTPRYYSTNGDKQVYDARGHVEIIAVLTNGTRCTSELKYKVKNNLTTGFNIQPRQQQSEAEMPFSISANEAQTCTVKNISANKLTPESVYTLERDSKNDRPLLELDQSLIVPNVTSPTKQQFQMTCTYSQPYGIYDNNNGDLFTGTTITTNPIEVTFDPAPQFNYFRVTPTQIFPGEQVTVSWDTAGMDTCKVFDYQARTLSTANSGTATSNPTAIGTNNYNLSCTSKYSAIDINKQVQVKVVQKPALKIFTINNNDANFIAKTGTPHVLNWSTVSTSSCSVTQNGTEIFTGVVGTNKQVSPTPTTAGNYTYKIDCKSMYGQPDLTKTIVVTNQDGPTVTVLANNNPTADVTFNDSFTISWDAANFDTCTWSDGFTGSITQAKSSRTVETGAGKLATGEHLYTLSCTSSLYNTTIESTAKVTVHPNADLMLSANGINTTAPGQDGVLYLKQPEQVKLEWRATYAENCQWSGSKTGQANDFEGAWISTDLTTGVYDYTLTCESLNPNQVPHTVSKRVEVIVYGYCVEDVLEDYIIDNQDYNIVTKHFFKTIDDILLEIRNATSEEFEVRADIIDDGRVDILDYNVMVRKYFQECTVIPQTNVPR